MFIFNDLYCCFTVKISGLCFLVVHVLLVSLFCLFVLKIVALFHYNVALLL